MQDIGPISDSSFNTFFAPIRFTDSCPLAGGPYLQADRPIEALHYHDYPEIGYCWQGDGIFIAGSRVYAYQKGDFCLIPPGIEHLARSREGTTSRWSFYYFSPEKLLGDDALSLAPLSRYADPAFDAIQPASVESIFRRLEEELSSRPPLWRLAIKNTVLTLLIDCQRRFPTLQPQAQRNLSPVQRIAPALQHMLDHYSRKLPVAELARRCHLSPVQFRRIFRQATGTSPHHYLSQLRVRQAIQRIRHAPAATLEEIAAEVGFDSSTTLYRQIVKHTGQPPSAFRA
ncbi:MAG: AraC family transcriptional regulator [Lentisphaerae bacterium]|nr:MAG: AraC family transcriptional regulator [Lentisphaerota bacterium]